MSKLADALAEFFIGECLISINNRFAVGPEIERFAKRKMQIKSQGRLVLKCQQISPVSIEVLNRYR